jgi:RNA polymerase sigma-70 factor (ECF subfamily)
MGPAMSTTPLSLLDRLQGPGPGAANWRRLQEIYLPLIRSWLARVAGLGDEAQDLSQEILVVLFRELPGFERRRDGAFRAWLRQITVNRIRAFRRARQKQPLAGLGPEAEHLLNQLADPTSELARQWDQDHDKHVIHQLLAIVQADFEPGTWQAFTRFALDGDPAAQVAGELGTTESAVVKAKSRILKRLREEAGGLLD